MLSGAVHRHYDVARTVSVLGPRRSGTTWVQQVLAGGATSCPVFEPLEGDPIVRRLSIGKDAAIAPGTAPDLREFLNRVMRGRHVTRWSTRFTSVGEVLRADRYVVKHVQLCLGAGWLAEAFPTSPLVVVVRHPCAVVQSMLTVQWSGSTTAQILAARPEACRLALELLGVDPSPVELFAALWAVEVHSLLRDTQPERAALVAYEAAADDPAGTLGSLMEELALPRPTDLLARSSQPSGTTHKASVVRRAGDPVTAWTDALAPADRDAVLAVVRSAGVEGYGADPRPDLDALRDQHTRFAG